MTQESFTFALQETALNHVKSAGLLGDGFGSTPEMCKRNLIWVVTRMQVLVDRYPTWLVASTFSFLKLVYHGQWLYKNVFLPLWSLRL